jgi:hypothetical protein
MTRDEWLTATEPRPMIAWLAKQGYGESLWDFAVACCRRVQDELPGEPFRRLIDHLERLGTRDIGDYSLEASRALDTLERRLRKASSDGEESRLNRQIGYGNAVLTAVDQQDGASAARAISGGLLEWAADLTAEACEQANSLRRLVPDPSERLRQEEV